MSRRKPSPPWVVIDNRAGPTVLRCRCERCGEQHDEHLPMGIGLVAKRLKLFVALHGACAEKPAA